MLLYHFTSTVAWEKIRTDGMLAMTDPQVNPRKRGRPVVWLTSRDVCEDPYAMGLAPASPAIKLLSDFDRLDKTRIRLTVEVGKTYTHRWRDWAPKNGGVPRWVSHISAECRESGSWYVHTHPIPRERWVDVVDTHTGHHLSIAPTLAQLGFRKLHA